MWLLWDGGVQAGLPCVVAGLGPCGCCGMAAYRLGCLALWLGLGPCGCCGMAAYRLGCLALWPG